MKGRTRHVSVGAVLVLGVLAAATAATAGEGGADFEAIAQRMVNQCAAVQEGNMVWIHGTVDRMELLENIAVDVRKRGAFPLLSVTTDDLVRRTYDDVPAKYDSQTPELDLKLARMVDAAIIVTADEKPALLADVPAERIAARRKAHEAVYNTMLKRNVRLVALGNGLYPTAALASQFGMSQGELATIFWDGVNVDYRRLQAAADTVRTYLAAGNTVRITGDNGTDIQMNIKGRAVHVNDGVISPDDVRTGGAACQAWLPAGEVFLTPISGTAEGTVVIDRHFFHGREIRGLRMNFVNGKLTSMTAESGLKPLKTFYNACGAGRDELSSIDIGVNPNVRVPSDSRMVAWMASGMITIGIGANTWAEGDNASEFALYTHLPNSTLSVDGKTLVDSGVLKR